MTDYQDWQTPQAHANAIAVTGVPLLSLATSLFAMGASQNVAAGTTFPVTGGPFAINQIGYELFVQVEANAASVFPLGTLKLTWSDSVSANPVWVDSFSLAGGSGAFQQYYATGPTKGDQLSVSFHTYDPAHAIQFQMSMVQNSRVFVRDDMRQLTLGAVPSFVTATYDPSSGLLVAGTPTIPGTTNEDYWLPFYAGNVEFVVSASEAFTVSVQAWNGAISTVVGSVIGGGAVTAAGGGTFTEQLSLPRSMCSLSITNNGAAPTAFTIGAVLVEQPA